MHYLKNALLVVDWGYIFSCPFQLHTYRYRDSFSPLSVTVFIHVGMQYVWLNPYAAKLFCLNFQPLEVENDLYLFNLRPNIYKYLCWNVSHFIPNNSGLNG